MSTATVETNEAVTVESLLKQIEQLPRSEQLRLAQLIEEQQFNHNQTSLNQRATPWPEAQASMDWLRQHAHEYAGEWVALDGARLIAHGPNEAEVWAAAQADGVALPLLHRIAAADEPPFMGI